MSPVTSSFTVQISRFTVCTVTATAKRTGRNRKQPETNGRKTRGKNDESQTGAGFQWTKLDDNGRIWTK